MPMEVKELYQKILHAWAIPERLTELKRLSEQLAAIGVKRTEFDEAFGLLLDKIRSKTSMMRLKKSYLAHVNVYTGGAILK
jgi:hypothetical protein